MQVDAMDEPDGVAGPATDGTPRIHQDDAREALGSLRANLAEGAELARRQAAIAASVEATLATLDTSLGIASDAGSAGSRAAGATAIAEFIDPRMLSVRLLELTHRERELRISTSAPRIAGGLDVALTAAKLAALSRGAVHRVLYDEEGLDQSDARHHMRYWADAGEQQRIVRNLPAEFLIAGSVCVILMPEPDEPVAIISEPRIVAAYTALFELAWRAGVVDPAHPETDETRRLVTLLESGYKDEVIARHLGVSLRTVRRRVAALMAEAGVTTRFQLGRTLAQRHGIHRSSAAGPPEEPVR